ncbi:MAG: tRNA pseudouridine(38-40) synthase TruA [Tissierellia bacterium]|nr:tRNA pseudouridine(38-40) synthase TruA [Tissierellia bacterium]
MNIALRLSYQGTNFHGYQIQPGLRTVEGELKEAVDRTFLQDIKLYSAGRTDRGVHAEGQVVNFQTKNSIDIGNLPKVINYHLPEDISVTGAKYVAKDFHARFSAQSKDYRYYIYNEKYPNALYRHRAYHFPHPLDVKAMEKALNLLIGEHDFKSFMGRHAIVKDTIRRIYSIEVYRQGSFIIFDFNGRSFLKNMIRIMVGTAVEIGRGHWEISHMKEGLEGRHRKYVGPTAPASGLYLMKIHY